MAQGQLHGRTLLRLGLDLDVTTVDVNQRIPVAFGAIQALDIAVHRQLLRVDLKNVQQALDSAFGLARLLLPHLRHAQVEAHPLGVGWCDFELVLENIEVGVGAARLEIKLLQCLERRQILRIDGEHLSVRIDCALVVAEAVLPQRMAARHRRDHSKVIGRRR